ERSPPGSAGEERLHELADVAAHLLPQRAAANAAPQETLIRLAVEEIDQHHGVNREHEEAQVGVGDLLMTEPLHPGGEHVPGWNQHIPFDADVDVGILDDTA